jgi:hypothetical protein
VHERITQAAVAGSSGFTLYLADNDIPSYLQDNDINSMTAAGWIQFGSAREDDSFNK